MLSIKSLIENLNIFERNKFPIEFKILGIAFYIHLSSLEELLKLYLKLEKFLKLQYGNGLENLKKK